MKLEGDYLFEASVAEVWSALFDPVILAAIMPGCEKLELVDGQYVGEIKVKVGPIQGKFTGKVDLKDKNELRSYTMVVDGRGAPGFVKATAAVTLVPQGEATRVSYDTDAQIGGKIASVGQRLIEASARAIVAQSLEGLHANIKLRAAAYREAAAKQATTAPAAAPASAALDRHATPPATSEPGPSSPVGDAAPAGEAAEKPTEAADSTTKDSGKAAEVAGTAAATADPASKDSDKAAEVAGTATATADPATKDPDSPTAAVHQATETAHQVTEAAGESTEAVGKATEAVGRATEAVGKATEAVGKALEAASKVLEAAGKAAEPSKAAEPGKTAEPSNAAEPAARPADTSSKAEAAPSVVAFTPVKVKQSDLANAVAKEVASSLFPRKVLVAIILIQALIIVWLLLRH
ncbi:MAG TPA: SRPBCC domain-containing protein [Kofleriaceae bacterium]|jgi:hypothetical protein|nr:SRPBCC domain-containing protein [Kofleriaceae bacterium]